MRRALQITWGVIMVLVAVIVLAWTVYTLVTGHDGEKYPGWYRIVMLVGWSSVLVVGIRRLRGFPRTEANSPYG